MRVQSEPLNFFLPVCVYDLASDLILSVVFQTVSRHLRHRRIASDVPVPAGANVPGNNATAAVATSTAGFASVSASAVVKPRAAL